MANRYPQGIFVFETIDARGALANQWGCEIPITVTNDDITQMGLLKLGLQGQPGFSFEDTLLAYFYAPFFTANTSPFTQLSALLSAVDPAKWQAHYSFSSEATLWPITWLTGDEQVVCFSEGTYSHPVSTGK